MRSIVTLPLVAVPLVAFLLLASASTTLIHAAEAAPAAVPEVTAFNQAMSGEDAGAKKSAIRALASKSVGKDAEVFPLLVAAISDRQAGETAVASLSSRAGKTPVGGSFRTGIDPLKIQAKWQTWLEEWKKAESIKKLEKKDEKKAPAPEVAVADPNTAKPASDKTQAPAPAEDLGKLDRVIFKAGGSLVCYVMSKRVDAEGTLISVRVVHPDGAGEETIDANLVSRIEEDIR